MSEAKRFVRAGFRGMVEKDSGRWVKFEDYAELQQKLDAMVAENAVQKSVIEAVRGVADNSKGIAGWHLNGEIARWDEILPEIDDIETPATDAYLNSVRAEGAIAVRNALVLADDGSDIYAIATDTAEQLRSGTHNTADKAG